MPLSPLPTGVVARATVESPVGTLYAAATPRGIALLEFAPPAGYDACPSVPRQRWLAQPFWAWPPPFGPRPQRPTSAA